ncbi:MAG TPA: DMT family transporter [Kofleriaceae bacterium]|nr:DMT family transporter [Kofleriaceae bacterium]
MPAERPLPALAAVAGAAAAWGGWSLFLRPAGLPSATGGALIFLAMGLTALPLALRGGPVRWDRRALALLAGNALFDATNLYCFIAAMAHTTVAIAVLTHYLAPVLVAVLAPWIDRRRTPGAIPAALVAIGGLALVLEPWHGNHGALVGGALGAASAVAYAGNVFTVRRLSTAIGAARAVSYHSFGAAALMLPFALAAGGPLTPGSVALVALGGVTLGALGGIAFVWGVARVASATAAMLTYLEPLVAVAIGALVWREPMGRFAALGAALVLASGVHVARASRTDLHAATK